MAWQPYGKVPTMAADLNGAAGISTIQLASSAQSLVEAARANASQTQTATPGSGTALLGAGGLGIGLLIVLGLAYILDRKVL